MADAKRDNNFVTTLLAVSSSDSQTPVAIEADPTTKRLLVDANISASYQNDSILIYANTAKDGSGTSYIPLVDTDGHLQVDVLSGGGGGTEYTEGDTDATITGKAIMWEDASDTLRAVSATYPLPVDITTSPVPISDNGGSLTIDGSVDINPNSTILNGQKTVATAGTAEALAASTACKWVIVKALTSNTGNVYVGNSSVSSSNGYILEPGEAISLDVDDLATVYIDVDTNGEGVSYIGVN